MKYGSLVFTKTHEPTGGQYYDTLRYYLKIMMSSGIGMATGCHAFLDVPQAKINHLSASWRNEYKREISIGHEEDLLLFTIYSYLGPNTKKEIFWLTSSNCLEVRGEYDDIKTNNLSVKLVANAKIPKQPFSETLEQIVNRAKEE